MTNNMNELHDWLFHYNPYRKTWAAVRRDDIAKYFNGELEHFLTSKKQSTLVDIILKTDGDEKAIKKLIDG